MEQAKRLYESTFIVNASLDDAQIDQVILRIQDFLKTNGGHITSLTKWGRRRLAYTIRKKNNGFYAIIEFQAQNNLVAQLERLYQLDESVIRYLTIQLDKKAVKARQATPGSEPTERDQAPPAPPVGREPLFENEAERKRPDHSTETQ